MKTVTLPGGEVLPALGLGTWHMGERGADRAQEADALRLGIDLGMTVIDTAEMYASGGAEEVVGDAIAGRRDQVFLVTKVLPFNADHRGTLEACDSSLRRLGVDVIDLYLLHWPSSYLLAETVSAFEALKEAGKIRHWGVSNFDIDEMDQVHGAGNGGCATNQILYNLERRGPEYDLLGWYADRGMPVMAYSPLEQARLAGHPTLVEIGEKHGVQDLVIALAWVLARDGVMAIPKAGRGDHVRANRMAADVRLDREDLAALDAAFPPPTTRKPLEIL